MIPNSNTGVGLKVNTSIQTRQLWFPQDFNIRLRKMSLATVALPAWLEADPCVKRYNRPPSGGTIKSKMLQSRAVKQNRPPAERAPFLLQFNAT